jgi:hypothetical protein
MSQSYARDFGPSFNTQIDRRGSGPAAKSPVEVNLFYATPAYLTFGAEASGSIDSSEPMQNLHSCFLIDIILNFIILIIIII